MTRVRFSSVLPVLAITLLLSACPGDDGASACEEACNAALCEACVDGRCSYVCHPSAACVGGACLPRTVCQSDADCGVEDCERCDGGLCVPFCGSEEICVEGECRQPVCESPCDVGECMACEMSDGGPVCVSLCDATLCEVCDDSGDTPLCVTTCNAELCEACDGAGLCQSVCESSETCDGKGVCSVSPVCESPNQAGYCEAVVLFDVSLANTDCCCDLTGDGEPDNALSELLQGPFGTLLGMSLEEMSASMFAEVNNGNTAMILELVGLPPGGTDVDHFVLNFLHGASLQPGSDLSAGDCTVSIDPRALDEEGSPLFIFDPSRVAAGVLSAGPGEVRLPPPPITYFRNRSDLVTRLEGATIEAAVVPAPHGYELHDGRLCGHITQAQIFASINSDIEINCDCLNLSGPFILDHDTENPTCAAVESSQCDSNVPSEETCRSAAQYCTLMLASMSGYMDVDLDGDPSRKEAMSVGVRFLAAPVEIVGEDPSLLSCAELLDCINACPVDQACLEACRSAASSVSRTQLDLLIQCLDEHCPGGEVECTNAAASDPEKCQTEAQACFG